MQTLGIVGCLELQTPEGEGGDRENDFVQQFNMRAKFPSTRLLGRRIFTCAGAVGIDGPRMLLNFKQALKCSTDPKKTWFYLQISKNSAWEDLTCPPQVLHVKRKLASFVLHETQTLKHPLQDLQVVVRVHFGTPVGSISSFTAGVSSFHSWHQANKCTNCLSVEKSQ